MTFIQKLESAVDRNKSLLCIGLDSDWDKLPEAVKKEPYPQFAFNKAIIDATHDLVCSYKPNSAFYEDLGSEGVRSLKMTCEYLHDTYPDIPIILDAKRADIGNTNNGYVSYAFDYLRADAITLHPYLGQEALQPFLDRTDKGCIILCRTSNPGAAEFQDLHVDGDPLYLKVAKQVNDQWNKNGNCLLVVGATYPEELKKIREVAPEMTFLIPGIGAQGGDLQKVLENGLRSDKKGLIISASRSIIFASSGDDFADAARDATLKMQKNSND